MTKTQRSLLATTSSLALLLVTPRASAITESYCTFQTPLTTWTLNQNAFVALDSEIRLTDNVINEIGSAFINTPITLTASTNVHAHFQFQMGPAAGGGDGISFVMQNAAAAATAIGTAGEGDGYGGIAKSVIISFVTYKYTGDPSANFIGVEIGGVDSTHVATNPTALSFTMAGAGVLNGWVDYIGATNALSVYVADSTTKPGAANVSYTMTATNNLFVELGSQMYVGFTAATGAASPELNEHDVLELEISTDGLPCECEGDSACSGTTPACSANGICATCSATNGTECTGTTTPVCDVPVNTCVGCLTNANCSGGTPICDSGTLKCRVCQTAADCGGTTPQCDTTTGSANLGKCVACIANTNCGGTTPKCNLTTNTCQQCLTGADCGGDTPVCNAGTCIACRTDTDCSGTTPACEVWGACGQCSATNGTACTGGTDVCDFPTGTCVACEFNSNCSGSTPTCDTTDHMCRACMDDADCVNNPGGSACVTTGMKAGSCVICTQDSDCTSTAAPKCDTTANECVQCLSSTDCTTPLGVCNASNICVGCASDGDCSGSTPICDPASSLCAACENDYAATSPGPLSCPTAALPACQPQGTGEAGQCGVCSSVNDTVCATMPTTPVCIIASVACGCITDSDCNADTYCDTSTTATGVCTAGCRQGDAGSTNCATGKYCTETNGTVGTCMSEPCNDNQNCTAPNGVCNTIVQPHVCVACLNDSDCGKTAVCDSTQHCVACTTMNTTLCNEGTTGDACLANETCGCTSDNNCGGVTSGRVCNTTTHACEVGCRAIGGNGCPSPDVCSSNSGSIGTCIGPVVTSMDAGMTKPKDASSSAVDATTDGTSGANDIVSQAEGSGCRTAPRGQGGDRGALYGLLVSLGLVLRRRRAR
jgi:Legume lectin domain